MITMQDHCHDVHKDKNIKVNNNNNENTNVQNLSLYI